MFGWLKRKLLKSIIKDIIKKMPKYKNIAFEHFENIVEDIVKKVKKTIEGIIDNEMAKVLNK